MNFSVYSLKGDTFAAIKKIQTGDLA
jgi:hypothetical protein